MVIVTGGTTGSPEGTNWVLREELVVLIKYTDGSTEKVGVNFHPPVDSIRKNQVL